jgi:two-component system alkaline phosphatase synthesis response regulator PhoP
MKKRILLAEDNKDAADIGTVGLQFLGYEVVVARDGEEAVERAVSLHPDLIVLDMMMPKMNGFEVASQLRSHPATKTIPILAATALAGSEDRQQCLASGCTDYISKPFTPRELGAAIERLLQSPRNELNQAAGFDDTSKPAISTVSPPDFLKEY